MSFFRDMARAVEDYPTQAVRLSFEDVRKETGTAGVVNVNEVWSFRVLIRNDGNLDMNNTVLHLHGVNGARVSTSGRGSWEERIHSNAVNVPAGSGRQTDRFFFKAPASPTVGIAELVYAHVHEWEAGLSTMFADRSVAKQDPRAAYATQVHP